MSDKSNIEVSYEQKLLLRIEMLELENKLLTEQVSDWKFEFNSLLDDVKRISDGV